MELVFTLNGKTCSITTPPDRRVTDLLREDLGLTGVKEGCGTGECGACTIIVDGRTCLSCLMFAIQLHGKSVVTVEGLADLENGASVRKAFVEEGAVQCGYCIPGMEMSALSLLEKNPSPCRDEIREGLSGNLCRCTGYVKIVDAVEKAAHEIRLSGGRK